MDEAVDSLMESDIVGSIMADYGGLFCSFFIIVDLTNRASLAAYERYLNFAGQPAARLHSKQRIYLDSGTHRSPIFGLFSLMLFYAPDTHLLALQDAYIDNRVHYIQWKASMKQLREEWEDINIYASFIC